MCKLKHLAVAAAIIGLATHVQAGYFAGSTDFEGADPLSDGLWSNVGELEIVADASVASVARAANRPQSFDETIRTNVLGVDGDTPIVRSLQSGGAAPSAATIYADALVKGYPLAADASAPEAGASDKILVYTRISQDGTATNLCVLAAASDADSTATEFVLTKSIGKDEWHRIVIKATTEGYQIYCDGADAANLCATSGGVDTFYALNAGAPMTSVAFQGTGYVDDLVLSNLDPAQIVHTLVWGEEFDSVSYTVEGAAGESLAGATSPYAFQAPAGAEVILTGSTGYRTFAATNTIGSASITLSLPSVTGIAKYFPQSATADQDGSAEHPYEIPNLAALKALQAAATETNCFGLCFLQTADIALDAAWPGIGIQNGKDLVSYTVGTKSGNITQEEADQRDAAWAAGAFKGTYDGGNFTVSEFQMIGKGDNAEGLDYCGFFNSTYQATIKNLKISYKEDKFAVDTAKGTKESGATFVGVAKNSTLVNLTSLQKDASTGVSCSKGFGGIAGYVTGGTTIDSCTNNVNITSLAPNKAGGIAMIAQQDTSITTNNILRNCQNNGTMTGSAEHGGLVGYVQAPLIIDGCESTVADQLLNHYSNTIIVLGVNKAHANSVSYIKHSGQSPANFDGLHFATVGGDVATFVYDADLTAGNTYKVMSVGATATYRFTEAGTIAFDTALATPTYAITAAEGLIVSPNTVGSVTTYTAVQAVAEIGNAKYADLATALSAATAGQTVKLLQNVTGAGAVSTAAATIDLNGKKLGTTGVTFTGTGTATLKGGDVVDSYNTITITAPAGEDLTLDGVTFHASVTPAGSGDVLLVTNCTFLCDKDTGGNAFVSGSGATVHSYGILFSGSSLFAQADVVNNWFAQGRRAAVQASYGGGNGGDLYFYGNTVDGTVNTVATADGLDALYPALQIFTNGRVFIENNTFFGQYLGEAFCIYNKGAYRSTDAAIVFSGNTVSNTVHYLWGIYDVDKSGDAALVNPDLYFGANTIGANVDLTHCVYKRTVDGVDMNGVTYSHTPATLALPAGVNSIYEWTHAAGAKDLYVNGTPADAVAAGTVIAVPGVNVTSDTYVLTADATLKNQYTARAYATVTVTVTGGANATASWTVNGTPAAEAPTTLTEGDTYAVAYVANEGYEFAEGATTNASGTAATENITIVIADAVAIAPAYPTYLNGADATVKAKYDAWKTANGADTNSQYENQFLVNAAPATAVPANALAITAIEQNATAGWDITVECTVAGVDLSGTVGTAQAGNGYLAVSYTDDLGGTWTTENINITASANGQVTVNVNKANAKFMKAKLSCTAEPAPQSGE